MYAKIKKTVPFLLLIALILSACSGGPSSASGGAPTDGDPGEDPSSTLSDPSNTPDPVPEDLGTKPVDSPNALLAAALERSLSGLSAVATPAASLPGEFTASGKLVYVDEDGTAHEDMASSLTVLRGAGFLALSAPELLGDTGYLSLKLSGFDAFLSLTEPFISSLELTPSPDGQGYAATVSAADMENYLRLLLENNPALPILYAAVSGDTRALDLNAALDGVFASGEDVELNFNVSDGILNRLTVTIPTASEPITAAITVEGSDLTAEISGLGTLSLTLGPDITLEGFLSCGDGTTVTLDWSADGSFSYIHYSADVTGLAIEGTLDTAGGSPVFTGYTASGNRGDRTDLTLTVTPGAALPEGSVQLDALSGSELQDIWSKLLYGISQ